METKKPKLRVGLIGTGFMGKTHSFGFASAERVFDLPFELELHTVADRTEELASAAARSLGFKNATGNWQSIVNHPDIDLVNITTPNAFHREMALAAIKAGKHVYCEKPLAPRASEAAEMAQAAAAAGVCTQVGFNYLCNPMLALARDLIASGELGDIHSYRGIHAEDYMADPEGLFTFRVDPVGGGVLADLGSHALATAEFLIGPIERVLGDTVTVIDSRPDGKGGRRIVEVDDVGRAFLRFANGASGSIEANWVATGRKMQHDFEIYGSRGALVFSQERFNELHFYSITEASRTRGFRRIEAGPDHAPYDLFCVAPGHQLGFNDLKAIEIAQFLESIAGKCSEPFGFKSGQRVQQIVEAIQQSAMGSCWIEVSKEKAA